MFHGCQNLYIRVPISLAYIKIRFQPVCPCFWPGYINPTWTGQINKLTKGGDPVWGCIIHQTNSTSLSFQQFEGLYDCFSYYSYIKSQSCYTNWWKPCNMTVMAAILFLFICKVSLCDACEPCDRDIYLIVMSSNF